MAGSKGRLSDRNKAQGVSKSGVRGIVDSSLGNSRNNFATVDTQVPLSAQGVYKATLDDTSMSGTRS